MMIILILWFLRAVRLIEVVCVGLTWMWLDWVLVWGAVWDV